MSISNDRESCAFCRAYLFEEDDVVYCPECGAPHHRECYNNIGHCALESLHGTENEYKKPEKSSEKNDSEEIKESHQILITCKNCGEKYSINETECPNCSFPNNARFANIKSFDFDFYGGVPKDLMLSEDVSAEDAKNFVVTNTHRYLPKFALMSKAKKASWNWIAFFFPGSWLLSRKMYIEGAIIYVLGIISDLLAMPATYALQELIPVDSQSYTEVAQEIFNSVPKLDVKLLILLSVGFLIKIVLSFVFGILGDWMYKKHVISKIKEIKKDTTDMLADFRKKGGVNLFLFLITVMASSYIPQIIFSIIS